jgi:beta-galactosidase/beta-glucuronidase
MNQGEGSREKYHSRNHLLVNGAADEGGFGAKWETRWANYPRKQLARGPWWNLNGPWQFAFDDDEAWEYPEEVERWDRNIQVPFAPESALSGIHDTGFHPRCWYRRSFGFASAGLHEQKKRLFLHFGAVDYEARVWVNGVFLGCHQGGHTPFCFDITGVLRDDGENEIIVRADDDPHDLAKPRGKQDWQREAHSIWYSRTSGIWQTVWAEEVPETYIDRVRWTPHLDRWEIGCEAFISGSRCEELLLKVKLTANGKLLANDAYQVINHEVHRRIALSDPGIDDYRNELLWSPEKPTLIQAEVELWKEGQLVDAVSSYTALRSISLQRDRFMLNGRPYYMRLVLDQGYWKESLMTAPTQAALKTDIELAKAAGFNGVRKHQKIEDPDFFYWADTLGLLVWGEMPSAYRFTHEGVERITKEWMEVIDRDFNHPSIVMWVPFNESWGVPDLAEKAAHQSCVKALYYLTKTLDESRPVIGNDGWESTATDVLGIHDYDDSPERLLQKYGEVERLNDVLYRKRPGGRVITAEGHRHDGQPMMLTEFGGISYVESGTSDSPTWGYSACDSADEFRRRYERLLLAVHQIDSFCGFCYTQLTDTFQEANGLYTMDRQPKFDREAMTAATRGGGHTRGELLSTPQPPALPVMPRPRNLMEKA